MTTTADVIQALTREVAGVREALERLCNAELTIVVDGAAPVALSGGTVDQRAEDATFEGVSEFLGDPRDFLSDDEFVLPDPRTFEQGDVIPEDVKRLETAAGDELQWNETPCYAGFDFSDGPLGIYLPRDTNQGGWVTSDFPLQEVIQDPEAYVSYSLSEAAQMLSQYGIETGQRRLKQYLNTGIAWTDHYNRPRECATGYLEVVKQDSPGRDAVVRITPEGLDELVRVMTGARDES